MYKVWHAHVCCYCARVIQTGLCTLMCVHVCCYCACDIQTWLCTFMCVYACACTLLLCPCYLDGALHLHVCACMLLLCVWYPDMALHLHVCVCMLLLCTCYLDGTLHLHVCACMCKKSGYQNVILNLSLMLCLASLKRSIWVVFTECTKSMCFHRILWCNKQCYELRIRGHHLLFIQKFLAWGIYRNYFHWFFNGSSLLLLALFVSRLLSQFHYPTMKFSLYFMGYADPNSIPKDEMERKVWMLSQPGTIELTQ